MLLQIQEVKEFLSIEYVSVVGLLIAGWVVAFFVIKALIKRCDDREFEYNKEIKAKDETIKDFGIKFYVLQEKIYTILEIQKKNKDV